MRDRTAGNDITAYDEVVQRTLARTQGMRKLITDLLDLTRIESGQKTREFSQVDLIEVARLAVESAAPDATAAEFACSYGRTSRCSCGPTGEKSRSY
jgi:signal transduction histidine kinase